MNGRIEHKIVLEKKIQNKVMEDAPAYMSRYYYSLNQNSHTTKQRYITNVIRFLMFYGNGEYVTEEKLNLEELKISKSSNCNIDLDFSLLKIHYLYG